MPSTQVSALIVQGQPLQATDILLLSRDGIVLKRIAISDLVTFFGGSFSIVGRLLTAGNGLTGGGDLSADRTFNVVAHADGSIVVSADAVQVGVLATDAQHGNRGGGTIHAVAVAGVSHGFMSSSDKTKLDAATPANTVSALMLRDAAGRSQVVDPSAAQDIATKAYVDATAAGLDVKPSVKAASTANLTLSGAQTVDGIALVAGDRCLAKDQTTTANNGIYVVASGAWTRAADMDAWTEVPGSLVIVEQGTVNADTLWICTADQGGTLGTTSITFTQFQIVVTAGNGLSKTGATLAVLADGTSLTVSSSGVKINTAGVTSAMLRDSVATSVICRSANSTGVPGDLQASADMQILARVSSALTWLTAPSADSQILARVSGALAWQAVDDTIHGNRGGGAIHAAATTSVAGFQSAADKTKQDNGPGNVTGRVSTTADVTAGPSSGADVSILAITLPLNTLAAGAVFKCVVMGDIDNDSAGETVHVWIKDNGGTKRITLNAVTAASAQTNKAFKAEFYVTIRSIGAGGTMRMAGTMLTESPTGAANIVDIAANAANNTIDTTAAHTLTVGFDHGTSTVGNIARAYEAIWEQLK